jgi:hypothetical protein
MNSFQIVAIFLTLLHTIHTIDDDENFYFINNNKYFFNRMKNCQQNYYFDFNYFKCRLCDENFNLIASGDSEYILDFLWEICKKKKRYKSFIEVFRWDSNP